MTVKSWSGGPTPETCTSTPGSIGVGIVLEHLLRWLSAACRNVRAHRPYLAGSRHQAPFELVIGHGRPRSVGPVSGTTVAPDAPTPPVVHIPQLRSGEGASFRRLRGGFLLPSLRSARSHRSASGRTAVMCRFTLEARGVRFAGQHPIGSVQGSQRSWSTEGLAFAVRLPGQPAS